MPHAARSIARDLRHAPRRGVGRPAPHDVRARRAARAFPAGLAAFVLAAAGAACTGGDDAPRLLESAAPVGAAGSYTLRTIGGKPLPVVLVERGGDSYSVLDEWVYLADDGSMTRTLRSRTVLRGAATERTVHMTGTWTQRGTAVAMALAGSDELPRVATHSDGHTLTLVEGALVLVYRR